jgi:hypothetical protein
MGLAKIQHSILGFTKLLALFKKSVNHLIAKNRKTGRNSIRNSDGLCGRAIEND